jgi:hypothetical protein
MMVLMPYSSRSRFLSDIVASSVNIRIATGNFDDSQRLTWPSRPEEFPFYHAPSRM